MKLSGHQKRQMVFFLSIFLFVLGLGSFYHSYNKAQRSPAAISESHYETALGVQSAEELLSNFSIYTEDDLYTIEFARLGSICIKYNEYKLVFTSPNVRVSGASPQIEVSGLCQREEDGSLRVSIPYKEIMTETPRDISLSFRRPANTKFKVKNVIGFWPEFWVLSRIEFLNTNTGNVEVFNEKEVSYITNNRISMQWK